MNATLTLSSSFLAFGLYGNNSLAPNPHHNVFYCLFGSGLSTALATAHVVVAELHMHKAINNICN